MPSQSATSAPIHRATAATHDRVMKAAGRDDLLTHVLTAPDPRSPRGVRHGSCSLLAAALAVVRSFTAIDQWAADASQP